MLVFLLGALAVSSQAQPLEIRDTSGLRLVIDADDRDPALDVIVPDGPDGNSKMLFPEHVTVRLHGQSEANHLYIFRPGRQGNSPQWIKVGNALEHACDFRGFISSRGRHWWTTAFSSATSSATTPRLATTWSRL